MEFQCRTQHFMWCNRRVCDERYALRGFQCRTQHFMWCNLMDALIVSYKEFQCRTQHFMWCNFNRVNPFFDS